MRQLTILLALLCLACGGDSTAPAKAKLDGTWKATSGDTTYTFTLATGATDSAGNKTFSGTGTQRIGATSRPFTISGWVDGADVIRASFTGLGDAVASRRANWLNSNSISGELFIFDSTLTTYTLSPMRQ